MPLSSTTLLKSDEWIAELREALWGTGWSMVVARCTVDGDICSAHVDHVMMRRSFAFQLSIADFPTLEQRRMEILRLIKKEL